MTDYTTADEIAAVWEEVRPEFAGAFHADSYSLLRVTRVSDGRGGTTTVETAVESGRCSLNLAGTQGREGQSADVVQSVYRLNVELPATTIAKADDVLEINGNRYQIISVAHPGLHGLFPMADLEAVK